MCESSTNFFNDSCHAAVLAGVKGMSQLPEHRQLRPLEIPWNNLRHLHEAGRCDKAYREDLSSSGVGLALGHLQRDWQCYLWLRVFGQVKPKETAANFLPVARLQKHFPASVCSFFRWAADHCLYRHLAALSTCQASFYSPLTTYL